MNLFCCYRDKFEVFRDTISDRNPYYYPYVKVGIKDRLTGMYVQTFDKDEEKAKDECRRILKQYRQAYLKTFIPCIN